MECALILSGIKCVGHTETHLLHLIQLDGSGKEASFCVNNNIPEVPLVTGISNECCAIPIIGPPQITLSGSSFQPPQKSITSRYNVPTLTIKFLGSLTALPETVTIL